MELVLKFVELFLHLDRYLSGLLQDFGAWTYVILFLVIFCETALVVTPVLPGDSLLFALGAFAANPYLKGPLELEMLLIILITAAILGDGVNYSIGKYLGPKVFHFDNSRFFRREYLDRTHRFYEKYGGKTIIIARFVPIVRTFAPFIAGIGRMKYRDFVFFNITGGVLWITSLLLAGYYFGNIPTVKDNFSVVLLIIILVSLLPGIVGFLRERTSTPSGSSSTDQRRP